MSTVFILDVTDAHANVEERAGFGVLDVSAGSGAGIIASASVIAELSDTVSARPTTGEARAWRQMRGLARMATNGHVVTICQRAYPTKAETKAGARASGIDRAKLRRIGHDIEANLRAGMARTITINDAGQVRTIAFVPAKAMAKLKELEVGGQQVPTSVKRALPKLIAA